jgi:outer membrane receptor protein involved in Fe transport
MATTIIAGALTAAPAFAQPVPDTGGVTTTATTPAAAASAAAADTTTNGDIVVTGSRIASPTLTSAAPLQVIDSKAIESTGANILQDVLLQNPVVGSPALSRTNSNFLTSSGGVATVNLRSLGDNRTLVLVDGHRFVSGVPNSPAVDLNSIPTAFIDHVEIVSGGESAIYGSDAVAGVVNIIYKKHFSGVEGNVQAGVSQAGTDKSKQANILFGTNFDDDRGNVMVYAGYSKDGAVRASDYRRTATDQASTGATFTGVIDDIFKVTRPVRSSYIPGGSFFSPLDDSNAAVTGDGQAFDSSIGLPQSSLFNRQSYRYISVPVERYTVASRANYEISPAANVFLDATFTHSKIRTDIEPTPLSSFDPNGVNHATGLISLGSCIKGGAAFTPAAGTTCGAAGGTIFTNPLVPGYVNAIGADADGDGIPDVQFTRRMTDVGDRTSTADRYTYEITTGVKGAISDKWSYEVYGSYGRTQDDQVSGGSINLEHMRNALSVAPGAAGDPGAIQAPDGSFVVCADANARAEGCTPANIFGTNKLSAAAAAYVGTKTTSNAFAEQIDTGADINGQLFDLWGAGPIRVAAGVEYRKETSAQVFDSLTNQGGTSGNALPDTSGSFDVVEGYGEIHVPLLTDKPFFKNLEARAAGRISKYSTVGTVYSYNFGGLYTPIPDITFRASYALATRAPNIGELFSGLSQTFPTGIKDPCLNINPTSTNHTYDAVCKADPSVAANVAQHGGTFTLTQPDIQGISGFSGGNPNLKEEKGRTLTAGVVINPRSIEALRNFSLTADYTRTKIKGAIVLTDRQTELEGCYDGSNPLYCQLITRRTANQGSASIGALTFVNAFGTNSGGIREDNIDVTASYKQGLGSYGMLSGTLSYTRMLKGYTIPMPGAEKDPFKGELGTPKDKFLATLDYTLGPITFEYRGQYIGPSYLDNQFVLELTNADGSPVTNPHDKRARIGAYYIQDLQVNVDAGDHFNFYLGVNNLLNISPPPIFSNIPGDTTGAETDASDYDAIGRRFYAGARMRF